MGKYIVSNGQNIFDISLHLYGSIEGVVDLMMNNTELSFADVLQAGDELIYTDGFIINEEIVSYYRMNNIIPANGERNVYPKYPEYPRLIEIAVNNQKTSATYLLTGKGKIQIDWGDNTPLQNILLSDKPQSLNHYFNSQIAENRKIRIYGDAEFQQLDLSRTEAVSVRMLRPVSIERLILKNSCRNIGFACLIKDIYLLDLSDIHCDNLLPLLELKSLKDLDLRNAEIHRDTIDNYLISLVKKYYGRRNCTITLTKEPSGEYREPDRDQQQKYILKSGMEAIWVLVNESAWNEGGYWRFDINGQIYTAEI